MDEYTNCLHFPEGGRGHTIQKNGCNSNVGPGFILGLREDDGSVLWIGTPVRFVAPVGGNGQCMHKLVHPTQIASKTPWSFVHHGPTFYKQQIFRGYLGVTGEVLDIMSTCDKKGSLCSTEPRAAHFNVNESSGSAKGNFRC